jgi:hypothetical protein
VKKRIAPSRVRYIKLGERGRWEKSCLERGINRIGFGTAQPGRFRLCQTSKWSDLAKSFFAEGKDARTANRFANEVRIFFEDDGSILWVTFVGERFHWGFADPTKPSQSSDLDGVYRPIRGGWQSTDLLGESLTKDRLSGALTKLAAYRGTSCDVDVADYVIRRINGGKTPEVEQALAATVELKSAVVGLIRLLHENDFELLVDLIFSTKRSDRNGRRKTFGRASEI